MPKHGLELTQGELDGLARLVCGLHMAQKDKELFALAFVSEYKVTREYRFIRLATIPGYEEDLTNDARRQAVAAS